MESPLPGGKPRPRPQDPDFYWMLTVLLCGIIGIKAYCFIGYLEAISEPGQAGIGIIQLIRISENVPIQFLRHN